MTAQEGDDITRRVWSNWSGNIQFGPQAVFKPNSVIELCSFLKTTDATVRPIGSGYSSSNLVNTGGTIVAFDDFPGEVLDLDADKNIATLNPNRTLLQLARALHSFGYGFLNFTEIGHQTLAGAISTGTHGTGLYMGSLSSQVVGLKVVTAAGEVMSIDASQDADLLPAFRLGLGALGFLTEVQIRVRPTYRLKREKSFVELDQVFETAIDQCKAHRGYEFYCFPFCDYAFVVTSTEVDDSIPASGTEDYAAGLERLRRTRNLLSHWPGLRRSMMNFAAKRAPSESRVGAYFEVLSPEPQSRFTTMEYHLPLDIGLSTVRAVLRSVEEKSAGAYFPIKISVTAGDNDWLSPFNGGPRMSIAVHTAAGEDNNWFFQEIEPLMRLHGGRPHWGAMHSLWYADFFALYPRFEDFWKLRRKLDPNGRFLNMHLRRIFGED